MWFARESGLVLLLWGGCERPDPAEQPPATAEVSEPAPSPGQPPPTPRTGLGQRVAAEIECARQPPADPLAIEEGLDASLSGSWEGRYAYADDRPPVEITVELTVEDGQVTGTMREPNTFARGEGPELTSTLGGEVLESGQLVLLKSYAMPTVEHGVLYVGKLDPQQRQIEGRWMLQGFSGTFVLQRSGLR